MHGTTIKIVTTKATSVFLFTLLNYPYLSNTQLGTTNKVFKSTKESEI